MKRVRLQLDVSPADAERLDRLVEATRAASRAEVVRRAIALFALVLEGQNGGAELRIVHPDNPDKPDRVFGILI